MNAVDNSIIDALELLQKASTEPSLKTDSGIKADSGLDAGNTHTVTVPLDSEDVKKTWKMQKRAMALSLSAVWEKDLEHPRVSYRIMAQEHVDFYKEVIEKLDAAPKAATPKETVPKEQKAVPKVTTPKEQKAVPKQAVYDPDMDWAADTKPVGWAGIVNKPGTALSDVPVLKQVLPMHSPSRKFTKKQPVMKGAHKGEGYCDFRKDGIYCNKATPTRAEAEHGGFKYFSFCDVSHLDEIKR